MTITNSQVDVPPFCGVNSGQHMFIPASDDCNELKFDIDTGNTGVTRTWQIKVTQFECNDLNAPVQDCLQWHEAATGAYT